MVFCINKNGTVILTSLCSASTVSYAGSCSTSNKGGEEKTLGTILEAIFSKIPDDVIKKVIVDSKLSDLKEAAKEIAALLKKSNEKEKELKVTKITLSNDAKSEKIKGLNNDTSFQSTCQGENHKYLWFTIEGDAQEVVNENSKCTLSASKDEPNAANIEKTKVVVYVKTEDGTIKVVKGTKDK